MPLISAEDAFSDDSDFIGNLAMAAIRGVLQLTLSQGPRVSNENIGCDSEMHRLWWMIGRAIRGRIHELRPTSLQTEAYRRQ